MNNIKITHSSSTINEVKILMNKKKSYLVAELDQVPDIHLDFQILFST